MGGLDASPKAAPSTAAPLAEAQLPFATYSDQVETVGEGEENQPQTTTGVPWDHRLDAKYEHPLFFFSLRSLHSFWDTFVPGSVQDHAFLQLLGIPEGNMSTSQAVDRCFLKVEVYDRFSSSAIGM